MRNNFALKIILIALISFYFSTNCFAQDYPTPDSVINKFTAELQRKGIDTICVYQSYFPGAIMTLKQGADTSCNRSSYVADTYFIWKNKGITSITLKTYCFDCNTININTDKFWKYYTVNRYKINHEKIKLFQTVKIDNGKKQIFTHLVDHSGRQDILLIIGTTRKELHFDDFDFEKNEEKEKNINYAYNWNSPSKKLQILLDKIIHINYIKLEKIK